MNEPWGLSEVNRLTDDPTADALFLHSIEQLHALRISSSARCKICGGEAYPFDLVDFNKSCDDAIYPLGICAIPVVYMQCGHCQFIFTEFCDSFTEEKWRRYVYNEQYAKIDPEYLDIRPRVNAREIVALLAGKMANTVGLDYGGGSGKTAALLREQGWVFDTYDPFGHTDMSPDRIGRYNFCSAMQVFEHTPDPVGSLREIVEESKPWQTDDLDRHRNSRWHRLERDPPVVVVRRTAERPCFALFPQVPAHSGREFRPKLLEHFQGDILVDARNQGKGRSHPADAWQTAAAVACCLRLVRRSPGLSERPWSAGPTHAEASADHVASLFLGGESLSGHRRLLRSSAASRSTSMAARRSVADPYKLPSKIYRGPLERGRRSHNSGRRSIISACGMPSLSGRRILGIGRFRPKLGVQPIPMGTSAPETAFTLDLYAASPARQAPGTLWAVRKYEISPRI